MLLCDFLPVFFGICGILLLIISLYFSHLGMAASLLLLSIIYFVSENDNVDTTLLVIVLAVYLAFFSIGMGPGAWLIPSEIFVTSIRAKAMSTLVMQYVLPQQLRTPSDSCLFSFQLQVLPRCSIEALPA